MATSPTSVAYEATGRSSGTSTIQQSAYEGLVRTPPPSAAPNASMMDAGLSSTVVADGTDGSTATRVPRISVGTSGGGSGPAPGP